jgi:hypothetical protein
MADSGPANPVVHRNNAAVTEQAAGPAFVKYCPALVAFETIFQHAATARSLSFEPTKTLNRCRISFTIAHMHRLALFFYKWPADSASRHQIGRPCMTSAFTRLKLVALATLFPVGTATPRGEGK